jgi:ribosome-binding ATPase YchF (GTP1/OBG family)
MSTILKINLKMEVEISELTEAERKELGVQPQLDALIVACYNILDLITFYTITGGQESRAWTLKRGENCVQAAGKVHSDFAEKFIKAEVVPWEKLVEAGSWLKAREKGLVQTVGKDYVVQDGDVIEFKI